MKIYIYSLVCPITFHPRYVGRTYDTNKRYSHHCKTPPNSEAHIWIDDLKSKGLKPILKIEKEGANFEDESYFIHLYKTMGFNITNKVYCHYMPTIRKDAKIIKIKLAELREIETNNK